MKHVHRIKIAMGLQETDLKANDYKKCDLKGQAQSATECKMRRKSVTLVGGFGKASLLTGMRKDEEELVT